MSEALCDHRRRLDEISALESIFSAEELKRSEDHGPSAGQFCASVDLPEDFRVVAGRKTEQDSVRVSHLPPIVLHYSLPDRYPSDPDSPPTFTLACDWLGRAQLGRLCRRLDSLWLENRVDNQGTEILFAWAHFLKNESLDYLGIGDVLDVSAIERERHARYLSMKMPHKSKVPVDEGERESESSNKGQWVLKEPNGPNKAWTCFQRAPIAPVAPKDPRKLDHRAVTNPHSTSILELLSTHDEACNLAEFRRQTHLCNVCLETKPGSRFTRFSPCAHILCAECAGTYFRTVVESGNVRNIRCPEERCDSEARFEQIKEHLCPEVFLRYDRLLLDATLATMGDIIPCPRPTCQYSVTVEGGDDKLATCFHCRYAFCVECRMGYHGVEPCRFRAGEERALTEEYRSANEGRRTEMEKRHGKRRLQEMVNGTMTREWIEDNSKRCPQCRASIQKSHGCNKMVCAKCDCHFCWLCEARLDPAFPYLHFNRPASKCFNLLFQGVEVEDDEEFFDPWFDDADVFDWAD